MNTTKIMGLALSACLAGSLQADARSSNSDRVRAKTQKTSSSKTKDKERQPSADVLPEVKPLAIVNVDIYPVSSEPILGGTLFLKDGKIEALLAPGERHRKLRAGEVPDGYETMDGTGLRAYPGLVAAGAWGLGLSGDAWAGARGSGLKRKLSRSYDAWSDDLQWAASAGITTAHVYKRFGSRAPFSERGAVLKVSPGEPKGVLVKETASVWAAGNLTSAAGRHSLNTLREGLEKWEDTPRAKRKDDPVKELSKQVFDGEIPLFVRANGVGAIATYLELQEEYGFHLVLYLSGDSWPLAAELAEADVDVVQHIRNNWFKPRDDRRTSVESGWRFDGPRRLKEAGVRFALLTLNDRISTGGIAGRDLTNLPMEAAFGQRGGLSEQEAIESITIQPARILGVDDRVGSLEVGKDADVILVDGELLDYRAWVRHSIVNGKVVYDARDNRYWKGIVGARDRALGWSADPQASDADDDQGGERAGQ